MVHRQALSRAPVDADSATNAAAFIDHHRRGIRTELRPRHFGEFHIVVNCINTIGRDHLDALVRARIDTSVAQDATVTVDEDVQLALQTSLRFVETDWLGVTDFDFQCRVMSTKAP